MVSTWLKTLVSQNRKRYKDDDVNLDLTYITDRVVAMGFPAPEGNVEAVFRNRAADVRRFLDKRHAGNYKVSSRVVHDIISTTPIALI